MIGTKGMFCTSVHGSLHMNVWLFLHSMEKNQDTSELSCLHRATNFKLLKPFDMSTVCA